MQLKQLVPLSVALSLAPALTGGCTDARPGLYIDSVLAFEDDDCELEVTIEPDQVRQVQGLFDPQFGVGYKAPILFGNQLVPLGDNDTLRAETSRIQLRGAEVTINSLSDPGGPATAEFTNYFSATIHPVDSESPGLIVAVVDLIPAGLPIDDGTYEVSIIAFGETLGGTRMESSPFYYPIEVKYGYATETPASCNPNRVGHPCGWIQDGYYAPCAGLSTGGCDCL